jgi:uncharacterized membrane protein YiaA
MGLVSPDGPNTSRRQVAEQGLTLETAALVGGFLAFVVGLFATVSRLDRDRAFYPTVAIVIASYYSLFAVMGGSTRALVLESLVGVAFLALAVLGFRSSLWVVVIALAAHGVFDLGHGAVISNPGVPPWWPAFCLTYDATAAGYLAWLITSGHTRSAS